MAFSAAVVLLLRFFPAECIFSCEGAILISQLVTTRLLRVRFYEKMDVSTGMQDDPFCLKTGLYTTLSKKERKKTPFKRDWETSLRFVSVA